MLSAAHDTGLKSPISPKTPGEKLGIIAGGGSLPRTVAQAAQARGFRVVAARFGDGLDENWSGFESVAFSWGAAGDAISFFQRQGVHRIVWCGTISRRPDFRSLIPSIRTLMRLPAALNIVRGGDDSTLTALARYLEREGFEVVPVQAVAPRLLTPEGVSTRRGPSDRESRALQRGWEAAGYLGILDAGQAVVASQERIIALEGAEGTQEMLARVGDLRRRGRLGRAEQCALVKRVKPQQDRRFDLPSIGLQTIGQVLEAGVSVIGLSAGESLVVDFDETLAAANAHRIAIVGFKAPPAGATEVDWRR